MFAGLDCRLDLTPPMADDSCQVVLEISPRLARRSFASNSRRKKMRSTRILSQSVVLLIALSIVTAPVNGQQKAAPPKPSPAAPPKSAAAKPQADQAAVTIETLLADDSYKVCGEIRNVGNLIRSGNIADLLDPIVKLAGPPKEFKLLIRFANAHAESLGTARILFAAWPVKTTLPQGLFAIEFSSAEEARKFEPQLREFMPRVLPTPTPTPSPTAAAAKTSEPVMANDDKAEVSGPNTPAKPEAPPFVIKQVGSLVILSDKQFEFKTLRPKDSNLLVDNQNYRQARDRFASEPIFIFINIALDDKERAALELGQKDAEMKKPEEVMISPEEATAMAAAESPETEAAEVAPSPEISVPPQSPPTDGPIVTQGRTPQLSGAAAPVMNLDLAAMILGSVARGEPRWPEAVGAAISFDGDAYVARVLLLNGAEGRASAVPFIPQLEMGPLLTLEAASVLPADTELFISASVDTPKIYESILKSMNEDRLRIQSIYPPTSNSQPELPFAELEKQLGLKIKDDLLPVLGHEIAVSFPLSTMIGKTPAKPSEATRTPGGTDRPATPEAAPNPVVLISVKDKQAARELLPRIVDGLVGGGKSLSEAVKLLAQTEKREDVEIVSYAGLFSYAFIGNFLVFSPDAATTRHVVDSYLSHQTLSSNSHFRNFTRWQPHQVLGQVYVSPALMESYRLAANESSSQINEQVKEFIARLGTEPEPLTYALSNDGPGALHEVHVPKNLLLMAVAGLSGATNPAPQQRNEAMALAGLEIISSAEIKYSSDKGKGSFATLDQLIADGSVTAEFLQSHGYKIELMVSGNKFEVSAVPVEYGVSGRLSYFINESGVLRGGDHAGAPATVEDNPVQ
jgi:hypothetical protein